ncbi:MAG: hypothetical protein BIFFINMI_01212 [Phycisphaerae bacterium]|nr:hypothetical protein [Phycisphaerae bacterium]
MFIIVPLSTDNPIRRRPYVNIALVAANVLAFVALDVLGDKNPQLRELKINLMLWGESPRWFQFVTSMFLHGSWVHLIGNMVFLWVFGNGLNQKMGGAAYLLFYLACGIFAGVGYTLFYSQPVVGASGAVFGVAAGYLVLFPLSRVYSIYWIFFFIGFLDLSGLMLIGYFIVYEAVLEFTRLGAGDHVAHMAHLGGAAFGAASAALLLITGAIARDQFDLLALAKRWRQRHSFRHLMSNPQRQAEARYGRMARPVDSREVASTPDSDPHAERVSALRTDTASALRAGDLLEAARLYNSLRRLDPDAVLPQETQLDLANQLMSDGEYSTAADAYEAFLKHFPRYATLEQVELLLGLIYARYLDRPDQARQYLTSALARLTDANQQKLARDELAHLDAATG